MGFSYKDYVENERTKKWRDKTDAAIGRIEQQKPFAYDVNADALYRNYRDQYIRNARTAMQDTMGQAAAMTGGYGNSYAATAGNQAYQQQMGKLNDVIPQLYQIAYDRYNNDRQDLYNRANLYNGMYADEFGRDYGMYGDAYDRAFANYQQGVSEDQWNRNFNEGVRQFNATYGLNSYKALYGSGKGSYGGNGSYGVPVGGDQETSESAQSNLTKQFMASIMTQGEYSRRTDKGWNYGDYVKNKIDEWQNKGNGQGEKLSTAEAAWLQTQYANVIAEAENKKKQQTTTGKKNTAGGAIRSTK